MNFKSRCAILVVILGFALVPGSRGEESSECPRPDEIAPCQCRTRGPSIQVRCTNSMMGRIMEAMMMIRRRVSTVDVLILENNNIPHLPSRAFGSIRVNRLFIENNRMVTIDRNAFAGIEEYLGEIYIKEPLLKSLPTDAIDFLRELTVFSIENSQIMTVPRVVGLRKLKLFKIDGSNIKDIPPRTLRDLPSLRYLHVSRSPITRLDIGVLESLKFLVLANFSDNQLNWVHPRAFRYMEELREVSLRGNRFVDATIAGRAMGVIKTLKKLDLSRNTIEELRQDSFVDVVSLEELDLSHNRMTDLKRGCFRGLPSLKSVDLSHNRIRTFHSDAFVDTPLVEELRLNYNALNQVSDLSFVMDTLPKLRFLDLSNNDVRDVPFGAFRGYPALERLYLASNQISRVSAEAFADMPSLAELDLGRNKLIADAVDGPIFNLPQLKILNLSFNKLSKLNNKLLTSLGSLRRLDVSHNGITEMEEDVLQSVRHLDYLNISYNNLREFHPKTFSGLAKLFELDAGNNELSNLSDKLLADQRELEYLSFANNQIQDISGQLLPKNNRVRHLDVSNNYISEFPDKLMSRLTQLEKLIFQRNSLQSLSKESFRGLSNLEVIDFHDNRIRDIEENAFEDLTSLKGLDLSLNIISTVGDTLEPLTGLMKLNLSDNYLTSLPRNAFHALRHLSTLDVSNNTIVEIGSAFTDMPELKYLDLSYNHLPMIKKGGFRNLPSLVGLRLDYNSIIELEEESFLDLLSLETLILTKNGISQIRRDTFRNLPSLEKLKLDDNLIEKLEERAFTDLFSLKELHMEHNLLEEVTERSFDRIPSIRFLNLSYNLLRDLPRSGFLGLDTLETLDLSFNDLRSIDEKSFESMRWLTNLKLNDNNICLVEKSAFVDTTSLNSLSLSNNRITRLHQSTFDKIQDHIARLEISGNPLSCDCNALWLRNWASDEIGPIKDEPKCSYPKSLSGNPLRMLRTSRFTCDLSRSSDVISNACSGVPLKSPAQKDVKSGLMSAGVLENMEHVTEMNDASTERSKPLRQSGTVSKPLRRPTEAAAASAVDDDDAVDGGEEKIDDSVDTEADGVTEGSGADNYEYYYMYYDEAGNVIEKSPSVGATTIASENKLQELTLNEAVDPVAALAAANAAAIANGALTGDTPTIYAGIQNEASKNKTEDKDDDKGMTIFGIPIPKIPFPILSFGLAPALSHGLLPIGRKGETDTMTSGAANLVKELAASAVSRRQSALNDDQSLDGTRGPDKLENPIYVEDTNINPLESSEDYQQDQQPLFNTEEVVRPKRFGYLKPQNPIIPLNHDHTQPPEDYDSRPKYFPTGAQVEPDSAEYYPKDFLPAIKFDHPIPASGLESHRRSPVQPIPSLGPEADIPVDRIHVDYNSDEYQQNIRNVHRQTEDGFLPLFQPNNADPMYSKSNSPSIQFLPNDDPTGPIQPNVPQLGPSFDAVPKLLLKQQQQQRKKEQQLQLLEEQQKQLEQQLQVDQQEQEGQLDVVTQQTTTESLRKRPTKVPPTLITKFPLTPPPAQIKREEPKEEVKVEEEVVKKEDKEGEEEYEYEYEDEEEGEEGAKEEEPAVEESSPKGALETTTTKPSTTSTESEVSTMVVEEVFGQAAESHITETSVEIVHKGTPPEVVGQTENGSTQAPDKSSTYEYEYYYEDDEETTKNADSTTSTKPDISTKSSDVLTTSTKQDISTKKSEISTKRSDILTTSTKQDISTVDEEEEEEEESTEKGDDGFSLQSILDLMKGNNKNNNDSNKMVTTAPVVVPLEESHEQALPRPPPSPLTNVRPTPRPTQRPTPRPTPASPIRTSTPNYDYGSNFLQNKRSSVTIDSVGANERERSRFESEERGPTGRSSVSETSPYPFHPDRLDPAGQQPNHDSDLKWYYGNYNNENLEPFVEATERNKLAAATSTAAPDNKPSPVGLLLVNFFNIVFAYLAVGVINYTFF